MERSQLTVATPSLVIPDQDPGHGQKRLMMQQKQMQLSEALQKQMQMEGSGWRRMNLDKIVSVANQAADRMITLEDFIKPGTPAEERLQRPSSRRSPNFMKSPLIIKAAGRVNLAEAMGSDIRPQKTPYAMRCDKRRKQLASVSKPSPFARPRLLPQLSVMAQGESFSQQPSSRLGFSSRSLSKTERVQGGFTKRVKQPLKAPIATVKRFQQAEVTLKRQVRENMRNLDKAFRAFDTDGGGTLDTDELQQVLYRFDILLEEKHFALLLNKMDLDGDGEISYEEFLKFFSTKGGQDDKPLTIKVANNVWQTMTTEAAITMIREKFRERLEGGLAGLRRSFKFVDKGASGSISFEEFKKALKAYITPLEFEDDIIRNVFASFAEDGTGKMTFYNFTRMATASTSDEWKCTSLDFSNPHIAGKVYK
jgi:Ca2+-binding EF-hand superfamily protein